jgi:hypothetical protein
MQKMLTAVTAVVVIGVSQAWAQAPGGVRVATEATPGAVNYYRQLMLKEQQANARYLAQKKAQAEALQQAREQARAMQLAQAQAQAMPQGVAGGGRRGGLLNSYGNALNDLNRAGPVGAVASIPLVVAAPIIVPLGILDAIFGR